MTDVVERLSAALEGRYRIERELGEGGMATVYLAADLKHDRKVAIKVLKPELAAVLGAERFVQEIKTTAALSHPHILPLYDSGEAGGFLYYVMPYLQGETIREKLNRETQFGIEEAVTIATEVADALDYAHQSGVIHRDIKPENILLHNNRPMVMDFGIALAVSAAAGGRMTETGLSLGTPHYMSPEQATADKQITARSDVYSLASVLYEMLAGEPPHTGGSAQAIIMKIIAERAQPVTELRSSVPPNVAAVLAKALEKLPADRFESAKAFRDALGTEGYAYATPAAGLTAATPAGAAAGRWGARRVMLVLTALAVVAGAAGAGWLLRSPEQPFRRVDLVFGAVTPIGASEVVISPDGSMIALAGTVGGELAIYLRHLDGDPEFRKLVGTETGYGPSFSPDNQWIVFRRSSDRALVKILVGGGGAVTLVPGGKLDPYWPHWGTDGQIVFVTTAGAHRVAASGGEPVPMPKVRGRRLFLLPDGSGVLHSASGEVSLYDFESDSSVVLVPSGGGAVYVPTGHLVYTADGGAFAVRFDLAKHRVEGTPVRVLERVASTINVRGFWVSATGVLVQHEGEGGGTGGNRLILVDPGQGADTVRLPPGLREKPRFSPDGRSIAMEVIADDRDGWSDIYTLDLVTGTYTQLTFDGDNDQPVWSPDGTRILFDRRDPGTEGGEDLFIKPADNSGPERRLTTMKSSEINAQQWMDDETLVFDAITSDRATDAFTIGADSGSVPVPYLTAPFSESAPQISPDGELIAFLSDETGGRQLWLRDFPVPQGKWNITRRNAEAPRWSPDGQFVYFWRGGAPLDSLFRARIDRTPNVIVREPELVVAMNARGTDNWDLHPDGRRFVVAVDAAAAAAPAGARPASRFLILQNWFSELRRLTADGAK